jgi:chemotaxis protein methyltransferase CheR
MSSSSSGQEPFTFSMLLDDHFPELRSWRRTFIGSDLSEAMLARCREGSYSQLEINRGLPALLLVRHFERQGARYRVSHQLREQWDFRHVNLSQPLPALPRPDLVLLRNVLIYLGDDAKRDVLARVRRAMHPDGWLLLGSGEHPPGLDEHFERVAIGANAAFRPRLPAALLRVSRTPQ